MAIDLTGGPKRGIPITDTGGVSFVPPPIPASNMPGGGGNPLDAQLKDLAMLQLGLALLDDRPVGEPFLSTNVAPLLGNFGTQLVQSRQLQQQEKQGEAEIGVAKQREERLQEQGDAQLGIEELKAELMREGNTLKKEENRIRREQAEELLKQNVRDMRIKQQELNHRMRTASDENRLREQANNITFTRMMNEFRHQSRMADVSTMESASKIASNTCGKEGDWLNPGALDIDCAMRVYEAELQRVRPDLYKAGLEKPTLESDLDRVVQGVQSGVGTLEQGLQAIRKRYGETGVEQLQAKLAQQAEAEEAEPRGKKLTPPSEPLPYADTREDAERLAKHAEGWLKAGIDITEFYRQNAIHMTPKTRTHLRKLLAEAKAGQ